MAGVKRKQSEPTKDVGDKKKRVRPTAAVAAKSAKPAKPAKKKQPSSEEMIESDTTESDTGFYGTSAQDGAAGDASDSDVSMDSDNEDGGVKIGEGKKTESKKPADGGDKGAGGTNSREAHQKQKQLAKERKLAKPNGDDIHRSKKIWERLRIKSAVPKAERQELLTELFGIITGRVQDFVFKHDSTRVIQTALKYGTPDQRKMIGTELKGTYKSLAESRYAKFLVGKILVGGDEETREMVISEFYGSIKRMINNPEASWILDDIYRGMATKKQKAIMLQEWYGPEFALFKSKKGEADDTTLASILEKTPEKRKPIMNHLRGLINQLIQKKMTGFTMLHDAMLQYFLNTKPGTEEATEFLELIKGDDEGDLLKNLAFTKNGARVVALALAYGTAKDRKNILKAYKNNIEIMAYDQWAHQVLLAALDVVDDTVLTSKLIYPELLNTTSSMEVQQEKLLNLALDKGGRIVLLYPLSGAAKWLFPTVEDRALLDEIHEIRKETSKKDPEVRRKEIVRTYSPTLLNVIAADPSVLAQSSFGCQFIQETLLSAEGDKTEAVNAVAALAAGDTGSEGHLSQSSHAGRMLKILATGGHFDPQTKQLKPVDPPLNFHNALYAHIKDRLVEWATGPSSFTVVAMVEADGFESKDKVLKALKKEKAKLEKAAEGSESQKPKDKGEKKKSEKPAPKGNPGSRILLEKLS
ncbi:pumilio domain-containing protein [Phyllosticta citribraziliensis]|uniref:Pumilio domain-containing protein n=1 Tax=Phyllosticta citribraziliensis TaxID=989973 RepID=A0ABR1LMT8_9PEZI